MVADTALDSSLPAESYAETRNMLLKDIDLPVIRRAWFTISHLLLDEGAKIAHMGCGDGAMTYAMAAINPKLRFIGVNKNKREINKAKETYELHNLEFKVNDVAQDNIFEPESLDAVINSYILHEVYSSSRYNERIVSEALAYHFKTLKKGGTLFIQDLASPSPEEFVFLELADEPSRGTALSKLSEADLLVWYSENARPRQDAGCGGFFLEEVPARVPRTRLFRLPFKWAYEFIMRKDDREKWESELPFEYTFFTEREFRKELTALGARVNYSGPHWDEQHIAKKFENRFRLFRDNGTPLGFPPTSFIAVATKLSERKSLFIEERRPSGETGDEKLHISAMRNEKTGAIVDVVNMDKHFSEIIPYRIDQEGYLKIYLHDGVARSIVNAVPRQGIVIDGKRWSGHMVEPIGVDESILAEIEEFDLKQSVLFARDYLGLKPESDAVVEPGPDYYPAPDFIDDRIFTYYLKVKRPKTTILPKASVNYIERFQAKGIIREFDANQVLSAIATGMIPNARLELQILSLMQKLKIKPENWSDKSFWVAAGEISGNLKLRDLLRQMSMSDKRFRDIKGTTGDLRQVNSIFVEEGLSKGSLTGLSSEVSEFVVHDSQTINTVVVLPLTKSANNDLHAGFHMTHLPVPQRHQGNGLTLSAPSFNVPPNVTTLKDLKKAIADKFNVLPEMVIKMGEPYYTHIGVTPQRIHPYAIAAPPDYFRDPDTNFLPIFQIMLMWKALKSNQHFMTLIGRAFKYLGNEIKAEAKIQSKAILKERFAHSGPDWALPVSYSETPLSLRKEEPAPPPSMPALAPKAESPAAAPTPVQERPRPSPAEDPLDPPKPLEISQDFELLAEIIEVLEEDETEPDKPQLER